MLEGESSHQAIFNRAKVLNKLKTFSATINAKIRALNKSRPGDYALDGKEGLIVTVFVLTKPGSILAFFSFKLAKSRDTSLQSEIQKQNFHFVILLR